MKYTNYTTETLNKVGYSVFNNQIFPHSGRIRATIVHNKSGNTFRAALRKADYINVTVPANAIDFPDKWYIVHAQPTEPKEVEFFFLSLKRVEQKATLDELPIEIGSYIHRKSMNGIYHVVYVNRDIIIITAKNWAKLYQKGLRDSPVEMITWSDYNKRVDKVEDLLPTNEKENGKSQSSTDAQ